MSNSESSAVERDLPDGRIRLFAPGPESRAKQVRVLIVGDRSSAEMAPLAVSLYQATSDAARVVFARYVSDVTSNFAVGEFPDLIVVLQTWSDEYSASDVHQLLAFAPLARLVVCYGLWCESDGRNRATWPLAVRVPLRSAEARVEREWAAICADTAGQLLPLSASRDEVFAADHSPIDQPVMPQSYWIITPDPAIEEFLRERLQADGHEVDQASPSVVIFDVDPWNEAQLKRLLQRRSDYPNAEIQALTSWPTPQLLAELKQVGVVKIVHKLSFETQDLVPDRASNRCETHQGTGSVGASPL